MKRVEGRGGLLDKQFISPGGQCGHGGLADGSQGVRRSALAFCPVSMLLFSLY